MLEPPASGAAEPTFCRSLRHLLRTAMNTFSRPGRSEASRTSTSSKPASLSVDVISAIVRNDSVDSDVMVEPSRENWNVVVKVTVALETTVTSGQDSTMPTPGTSATANASVRFHLSQPGSSGTRLSKTR